MKFYIVNILTYNSMFDLIEAHTTGKSYRTIDEAKAEIDRLSQEYLDRYTPLETNKYLTLVSNGGDADFIDYDYEEIEVQF